MNRMINGINLKCVCRFEWESIHEKCVKPLSTMNIIVFCSVYRLPFVRRKSCFLKETQFVYEPFEMEYHSYSLWIFGRSIAYLCSLSHGKAHFNRQNLLNIWTFTNERACFCKLFRPSSPIIYVFLANPRSGRIWFDSYFAWTFNGNKSLATALWVFQLSGQSALTRLWVVLCVLRMAHDWNGISCAANHLPIIVV